MSTLRRPPVRESLRCCGCRVGLPDGGRNGMEPPGPRLHTCQQASGQAPAKKMVARGGGSWSSTLMSSKSLTSGSEGVESKSMMKGISFEPKHQKAGGGKGSSNQVVFNRKGINIVMKMGWINYPISPFKAEKSIRGLLRFHWPALDKDAVLWHRHRLKISRLKIHRKKWTKMMFWRQEKSWTSSMHQKKYIFRLF